MQSPSRREKKAFDGSSIPNGLKRRTNSHVRATSFQYFCKTMATINLLRPSTGIFCARARLLKGLHGQTFRLHPTSVEVKPSKNRCLTISPRASSGDVSMAPSPSVTLQKIAEVGTMLFPVWALISASVAFYHPPSLNWMTPHQFEQGVGLLMLAMGLSLSLEDFKKCVANPVPILLGFLCQYCLLPLLAVAISQTLHLSPAFATGLILLGCMPGGQASNTATFVARGDVALSVLMTTASTMAAAVMTPTLASLLAGKYIPVNAWGIAESTARLVLLPTLSGVALNEFAPKFVARIRPAMPLIALFLTVVLCAVPVAQVAPILRTQGLAAMKPVALLHFFGYFLGYFFPKMLGFNERTSRTVSIETGMQSAAMGYALSTKHFADILVAVPSSVSIVIMVWMGAALAVIWRSMPPSGEQLKE